MSLRYDTVVASLRRSYDAGAEKRDAMVKQPWRLVERAAFLDRLKAADCRRLLEIGAGTGQDSVYFAEHGLDVVATDRQIGGFVLPAFGEQSFGIGEHGSSPMMVVVMTSTLD